ncbi:MAG TPA: triose-phosphate isomerase [Gemmatimonadales bacterium]|nr:triose-phosphate isomerase [Gemmatimonadales bacterium]
MSRLIFAANWKMHHAPAAARQVVREVLARYRPVAEREVVFFPPAVSLAAVVDEIKGRRDVAAGVQNIHWEAKGAFTGEISAPIAAAAGAAWTLVGHSERRHKFDETDAETGRKVHAALAAGLLPMLCVGELIEERRAGSTEAVVLRQLGAGLAGLDAATTARVAIAYEPVWAIGTGVNATPSDAAAVHRTIRRWLAERTPPGSRHAILYGGSVNAENSAALMAEEELDGVLVGGASLEADSWLRILETAVRREK